MSSVKPSPYIAGDLRGVIYDFEAIGGIVPKHTHGENDAHITFVIRGKIKAYSHDWEQEAVAGNMIDFPVGQPHELMALEPNTRIVNILKKFGGIPNDTTPA